MVRREPFDIAPTFGEALFNAFRAARAKGADGINTGLVEGAPARALLDGTFDLSLVAVDLAQILTAGDRSILRVLTGDLAAESFEHRAADGPKAD